MKLIQKVEAEKNIFFTYHYRPQKSDSVQPSFQIVPSERIGIVVQGPLVVENDFTLESMLILRKVFPQARIMLSAWESEDRQYLTKFEENRFEILLNTPPENPGPKHINWQMHASLQGLKSLAPHCDFLLKTRTDQRIYSPDAAALLVNLIKNFPVAPGFKQRGRIVGTSLNSFKYRLYDVSDMLVFGYTDDVLRFWGAGLDSRPKSFFSREPSTLREFAGWNLCEMYLTSKYLENIGRDLKWTLQDSWQAWRDHFCIIDASNLNLFWYKYKRHHEHRYRSYSGNALNEEIDFAFWMNLYSTDRISGLEVPEHYLDLPLQ